MVTKNAKSFLNISTYMRFLGPILKKIVFLKNGHGRHQMGAMPIHFVFIFHETWWRRFAESFTQKFSSVSKLPIFQKHCFFKNGPKNVTKVEKFNFFVCVLSNHFIGLFNGILHVLILWVVSEKQGFRFLRNGVYINLLQTVLHKWQGIILYIDLACNWATLGTVHYTDHSTRTQMICLYLASA